MARNEALEHRLAERPQDRGGYEVYADWLLGQGDPHGELIMAMLRAEDAPSRELAAQIAALQAAQAGALPGVLTWKRGFIDRISLDRIRVDDPVAPTLATVLDHPASVMASAIEVRDFSPSEALDATIDVIATRAPHTVRSLAFAVSNELSGFARIELPRLDSLAITSLESSTSYVAIRGMSMGLGAQVLRDIAACRWPLTHLTLDFSQGDGTFEDLRPLFERSDVALTHLACALRVPTTPTLRALPTLLVRALVASPRAAQLEQLRLAMDLSRADYRVLIRNKDRFLRLREVELPNERKAKRMVERSAGYDR